MKKAATPKTKLDEHQQYMADSERLKQLAVATACDAFTCSPEKVLEMLIIFGRNKEFNREDFLRIIATEIYPFPPKAAAQSIA